MSVILSIQNNTMYFEQFVRDQLETQESEARAELKEREAEVRELKYEKARDSKIVEELRPLCEEIPNDALDPVTMEPLYKPATYGCGHTINSSTIVAIAKASNLCQQDLMSCPVCKNKSVLNDFFVSVSLKGCVEIFEKISKVFAKNT